jgi:hypothetical protein
MALLLGLTGPPGAGKDASAAHLVGSHNFKRFAFADQIRQAALVLDPLVKGRTRLSAVVADHGWDIAKTEWPEVRRLLQVLGTELGRDLHGPDVWVDRVFTAIGDLPPDQRVVISDCRFPNEAAAVRAHGGFIVRINRTVHQLDAVMSHPSETESAGLKPDYVLSNHGTLGELARRLDRLVPRFQKQRSAHA